MMLLARRGWRAAGLGIAAALCGAAGAYAWQSGMWGLLAGATLSAVWLASLAWWNAARAPALPDRGPEAGSAEERALVQNLLLDAAPTPLVSVHDGAAHALNRAARAIFGTDDRIVPPPAALSDDDAPYLHHEGRRWRIDRVAVPGGGAVVAALIDVEQEERAAEARASAELIEILGHELLNGLAPIVSLAESAQSAAARRPVDPVLLEEVLGPLARRAEGLQRFATGYRDLARLPSPDLRPVPLERFAHDLATGFAKRWPAIGIDCSVEAGDHWTMDRDQMSQAVWALLNNAAEASIAAAEKSVALRFAQDAKRMTITVTDHGIGIAAQNAAHIFRPFHTTKAEGSGIGLSLARQIARAHGGTLELVGANPTVFRMTLPTIVRE